VAEAIALDRLRLAGAFMANRYGSVAIWLMAAGLCARAAAAPLHIMTEQSPPAAMRAGDSVTGRETEKIQEMMARTGTAYTLEVLPWKRAYTMALSQDNACVYSTSRTPDRDRLFKWIGPTDEADWIFFGRADHSFPLRSLEDARKLRIGTYNGDARDEFLRTRGFNVDPVSNDQVNPQKLLLNRIDLWAVAMRRDSSGLSDQPWADKVVPLLVFNRVQVYLACNLAMPDALVERLNAALADMRRDGTVAKVEHKYEHWAPPKQ